MSMSDFTVTVDRTAAEAVVRVRGEIDVSTVGEVSAVVEHLFTDPPPKIVLDLEYVGFCDSQGLGTLVVLSRKARMVQSHLVLANVGDFLLRVLDVTGLRSALIIA